MAKARAAGQLNHSRKDSGAGDTPVSNGGDWGSVLMWNWESQLELCASDRSNESGLGNGSEAVHLS